LHGGILSFPRAKTGVKTVQRARFVQTLGYLLMLGLAAFGGGCGEKPRATVPTGEEAKTIKEYHQSTHQQLKADAQKSKDERKVRRKGAHRGQGQAPGE
jgi:hypothetical protein